MMTTTTMNHHRRWIRTDDCEPSWSGRCPSRAVLCTRLGCRELRIGKATETEVVAVAVVVAVAAVVVVGDGGPTGEPSSSDETF
jgi:hypothetical protein